MTLDVWLRVTAIALPLIGTFVLWRWNKSIDVGYWLTIIIFSTVGLVTLGLVLLNKHFVCIFSTGKQNCLTDGLFTLSLILLCAVLIVSSIIRRDERQKLDYRLMLFLSSAWAGIGLAKNLLVLLIFLNLFFYVIYKWLDQKGLGWGMFITRYDYRDDQHHYRD